ncbi:unnamed protein product, partial [Mesorhabditis belari]|uniref:Uncharacterized protein n=1 Tax=Mesorhabditis belari TaxID=2138241 RepID=A0AAF3F2L2_9BILA
MFEERPLLRHTVEPSSSFVSHELNSMSMILVMSSSMIGYRPLNRSHLYYCRSAFGVHNEVVNIWTHFVPFLMMLFIYILPELQSTDPRPTLLLLYFGIATLVGCSTVAHTMHSRSYLDHFFWWCIDFSGIAIWSMSAGITRWQLEDHRGEFFDWVFPVLLVVLVGIQFISTSFLFVAFPHWKYRQLTRMLTCLVVAIYVHLPGALQLFKALFEWTFTPREWLQWQAIIWLAASGVFMGAGVPERWFPGRFDLLGYGHQLFHVCINLVNWNLIEEARVEMETRTTPVKSDRIQIASMILLFSTAAIGYINYYLKKVCF